PFGNTVPSYAGTIHFTSSDASATLPPDYTFTGPDAGKHTFAAGVVFKTTGKQSVTATDTVSGITGSENNITVTAPPSGSFRVTLIATPRTAGVASDVKVEALDGLGLVNVAYLGKIHFTSSDPAAVLPADYQFVVLDLGVHTFSSGVTLETAGTQQVTVKDTVTPGLTGSEAPIVVNPAAANHFSVTG